MPKIFTVKVIPNSKTNKIVSEDDEFLKIKLTAPALDNKANQALIKFLSSHWKVAKNKIQIISGEKSRDKKIQLL